jgi:hypothetical protein
MYIIIDHTIYGIPATSTNSTKKGPDDLRAFFLSGILAWRGAGAKINKILFSAIAFGLLFEIIFYTEPMQRQIFRQTNARFPYKLWLRLLIRTT